MEILHCPSISSIHPKFSSIKYFRCRKKRLSVGLSGKLCEDTQKGVASLVVMNNAGEGGEADTAVVVETPSTKPRRLVVLVGCPVPFGATPRDGGVNFVVSSSNATSVTLCLMGISDLPEVNKVCSFCCIVFLRSRYFFCWFCSSIRISPFSLYHHHH